MYMYDDQLICLDREKRTRPMALDPWKVTAPPRPWNLSRRLFSMGKHMEKISVDSSGEDTGFEQDNIHWIGWRENYLEEIIGFYHEIWGFPVSIIP